MSKGSKPRPFSVTQQEYDNRWDAIFGKDVDTAASASVTTPIESRDSSSQTTCEQLDDHNYK